jgi:hypothetical protein
MFPAWKIQCAPVPRCALVNKTHQDIEALIKPLAPPFLTRAVDFGGYEQGNFLAIIAIRALRIDQIAIFVPRDASAGHYLFYLIHLALGG